MAPDPSLSVVVASRDRPRLLQSCLAAVRRSLRPGDELIVVDSASRDEATGRVAAEAGATVVRCTQPGLARARNAGWPVARADLVAFTDDDCEPAPGWAGSVTAAFTGPAVGWVTGLVEADRHTGLPVSVGGEADGRRFRRGASPFEAGHGANMAFRRETLVALGGFDESLGAGARLGAAEDTDAFWRALELGWEGVYEPSAAVTHIQWRGTASALAAQWRYGLGAGAFAAKAHRLQLDPGWELLREAAWTRAGAQAGRDLRAGYQTGAVIGAVRATGALAGAVAGMVLPLGAGRFTRRRRATGP